MEWERKWAADPPLATGDRASAEQPVTHAFQQLPEAKLTEAVECRRKLCRVVVQAKGESELEQVIHTVFGFNTPPLLKHASIVAERETGADGSVTATLFLWSDRSAGAVSP